MEVFALPGHFAMLVHKVPSIPFSSGYFLSRPLFSQVFYPVSYHRLTSSPQTP
jgi:hypothetical protein